MIIGYARVSTTDQNLDLQLDELKKYGCDRIYSEKVSTRKKDRPELAKCLDNLRSGDKLVVWKLDRLDRGIKELVLLGDEFRQKGIDLVSLTQGIDTSTPQGRMVFGFGRYWLKLNVITFESVHLQGLKVLDNVGVWVADVSPSAKATKI